MSTKLAIFEQKQIRRTIFNDEWWFSVIDIIDVLNVTSREPRKYWSDLKKKLIDE
jgi:DNA-damage-inducible protein D